MSARLAGRGRKLKARVAERVGRGHEARCHHDAQLRHQAAVARSGVGIVRARAARRTQVQEIEIVLVGADDARPRQDADQKTKEVPAPHPERGHRRVRYGLASKGVKEAVPPVVC